MPCFPCAQDRLALRTCCRSLFGGVPYGGLQLSFPMSRQDQLLVPSLAERSAITSLAFQQGRPGRLCKAGLKRLLCRLSPALAPAHQRCCLAPRPRFMRE